MEMPAYFSLFLTFFLIGEVLASANVFKDELSSGEVDEDILSPNSVDKFIEAFQDVTGKDFQYFKLISVQTQWNLYSSTLVAINIKGRATVTFDHVIGRSHIDIKSGEKELLFIVKSGTTMTVEESYINVKSCRTLYLDTSNTGALYATGKITSKCTNETETLYGPITSDILVPCFLLHEELVAADEEKDQSAVENWMEWWGRLLILPYKRVAEKAFVDSLIMSKGTIENFLFSEASDEAKNREYFLYRVGAAEIRRRNDGKGCLYILPGNDHLVLYIQTKTCVREVKEVNKEKIEWIKAPKNPLNLQQNGCNQTSFSTSTWIQLMKGVFAPCFLKDRIKVYHTNAEEDRQAIDNKVWEPLYRFRKDKVYFNCSNEVNKSVIYTGKQLAYGESFKLVDSLLIYARNTNVTIENETVHLTGGDQQNELMFVMPKVFTLERSECVQGWTMQISSLSLQYNKYRKVLYENECLPTSRAFSTFHINGMFILCNQKDFYSWQKIRNRRSVPEILSDQD